MGKGVTSLTRELDRQVTIEDATPVFAKCFSDQFECDLQWTELDFDNQTQNVLNETQESVV